MSTRSAPTNWLLGKPTLNFSTARLPRSLDVLRAVQFYHLEEGKTLPVSYKQACEAVLNIWQRARIPTQRIDSCVRKLSKLYERYLGLKKHHTRQEENDRVREDLFKSELEELFDVAVKDAMTKMKNDEDKEFLLKQREDVFSCSMIGADLNTTGKEIRKRQREEKERKTKEKYKERENKSFPEETEELSMSSSSQSSENEDEFQPAVSSCAVPSTSTVPSTSKRCKNIFMSPEVVGALDRVNLPDRGAVFVTGAIAKAFGHDISDITLSRSSIRRARRVERQKASAVEQEKSLEGPFILHWDGKLLPDIDGSNTKVDRIAILLTGNGQEKLLGIPKIERGTGKAQAQACIEAVKKWNVESEIKGLVFDTTASNTGLHTGDCTIIEKTLECELVWIACRHHVMEILLSAVFISIFGSTGGPETKLFNHFQKEWSTIDHNVYSAVDINLFQDPILNRLQQEMLEYLPTALEKQQPRDDYQELLHLALLFLGGKSGSKTFQAPGPTHHARWMAKAIYTLKICLFRKQFKLTPQEARNIENLTLFVSLVYVKYWNEAPIGNRAPYNDIQLLHILKTYPDKISVKKLILLLPGTFGFFLSTW